MVAMWELFKNFVGTFSIPMVSMVLCGNYNSLKLAVEMVGSLNKFDWINFSNSKIFKTAISPFFTFFYLCENFCDAYGTKKKTFNPAEMPPPIPPDP